MTHVTRTTEDKFDPRIEKLIRAWQTMLRNMIEGDVASANQATAAMLCVASYWRGEAIGGGKAAAELVAYAQDHLEGEIAHRSAVRH